MGKKPSAPDIVDDVEANELLEDEIQEPVDVVDGEAIEVDPDLEEAKKVLPKAKELAQITKEKAKRCLVASTVYNDDFSPEVLLLKGFRDNHLQKSTFGKWAIKSYYKYSHYVVRILDQHTLLKELTRIFIISPIVNIINKFKKG